MIETDGVLWIIHDNGYISKKEGNYKKPQPPQRYKYPELEEHPTMEALSAWYNQYEVVEQQNDLFAQSWKKEQKKKLQKIKSAYRKQRIKQFTAALISKIKGNAKQR